MASRLVWGQEDHRSSRWRETRTWKTIPAGAGHRLESGWTERSVAGRHQPSSARVSGTERPAQPGLPHRAGEQNALSVFGWLPNERQRPRAGNIKHSTEGWRNWQTHLPGKQESRKRHAGSRPAPSATDFFGCVAQSIEHALDKREVTGLIPVATTRFNVSLA